MIVKVKDKWIVKDMMCNTIGHFETKEEAQKQLEKHEMINNKKAVGVKKQ